MDDTGSGSPLKGLNDAGLAARTLFDFLSVLSVKGYSAAAYYVDDNVATPSAGRCSQPWPEGGLPGELLHRDGRAMFDAGKDGKQAQCGPPGPLLFQVSFQTSDFQPLKIGSRSSFDFRVAKTPDGFKVLDLPPRIP